jgi:hypothetical protein
MQEFPINWFAILAAVIIKQAIGAFWYSPALWVHPGVSSPASPKRR